MYEEAERQISAWESMFENVENYPKSIYRHKYEYMSQAIEESALEFTEEQQERIDVLVAKIEAKLAELEENEDILSTESDSSDGS